MKVIQRRLQFWYVYFLGFEGAPMTIRYQINEKLDSESRMKNFFALDDAISICLN